uniref:Uncharacterized protein n=1 Tax=Magallana gigas TaxID=29159 RepID=K1RGA1_MAGGI
MCASIMVGWDYEDYETARKYNKRALDTSNVETQSEGESKKRKQLVPSRFLSDTEIDSEGKNVSPPGKSRPNCKLTPLWKNGTYTASRESPSPVNPGTMYTPITVRTQLLTLRRSPRSKTVEQRHPSNAPSNSPPIPAAANELTDTTNLPDLFQQVISKLNLLQQDVAAIKSHLIVTVDTHYGTVETLLPQGEKLNSSREVEEFQENLDDSSQKKLASTRVDPKIIALTSLQGGSNAGEITRVIMRSIMTNNCMSQFSGCGQKGKRAFIGTQLYKIVLSAARKASKKSIPFETIKREVLDVLRLLPTNLEEPTMLRDGRPRVDDFPEESD